MTRISLAAGAAAAITLALTVSARADSTPYVKPPGIARRQVAAGNVVCEGNWPQAPGTAHRLRFLRFEEKRQMTWPHSMLPLFGLPVSTRSSKCLPGRALVVGSG
jgi:hypothetical protein